MTVGIIFQIFDGAVNFPVAPAFKNLPDSIRHYPSEAKKGEEHYAPILSEYLTTQHKLIAMDLEIKRKRKKRTLYDLSRIKCSGLTSQNTGDGGKVYGNWGACMTYTMSIFPITPQVEKRLDMLKSNFLWQHKKEKRVFIMSTGKLLTLRKQQKGDWDTKS
ncbi:hypothetical protein H5410_005571 [Solanum commersonii]|uniref:Uncharacterized protein n=1 Tax=Solanum commersonii TaxID=4109 RepID=A0A9J6A747_SOLCO|nr:hypothetical protein H5410_005571 [Solanum commersonii]